MCMFKKPTEAAYLKAGFLGLASSGKTYTAMMLAVTMAKREKIGAVYFLDTEGGSEYLVHRLKKSGVELRVAKTRAFSDLLIALANPEIKILVIDSITHFWQELQQTYLTMQQERANKNAARWGKKAYKQDLQFQDWAYIKFEWGKFINAYLNNPMHIIMCGRLGYEWNFQENDKGKKELIKENIKMKAEGETGYEASLLVHMSLRPNIDPGADAERVATVLKDRFGVIDGKKTINPQPEFFLPHIKLLQKDKEDETFDQTRKSTALLNEEVNGYHENTSKKLAYIILDQIKSDLDGAYPGSAKEAKAAKAKILTEIFGTCSYEAIGIKDKEVLRQGYDRMMRIIREQKAALDTEPVKVISPAIPTKKAS